MKNTVVRTIIIEGDAKWVAQTLEDSRISPDKPFTCPQGEIHEIVRQELGSEG